MARAWVPKNSMGYMQSLSVKVPLGSNLGRLNITHAIARATRHLSNDFVLWHQPLQ
jgi:hypothetical protein